MELLLMSLGYRTTVLRQLWLISIFMGVTLLFLIVGQAVTIVGYAWIPVVWHLSAWCCWFFWLSCIFPRRRKRYLQIDASCAYRRAFYSDILPGVSFGVSQMCRPSFYGIYNGGLFIPPSPWQITLGTVFC